MTPFKLGSRVVDKAIYFDAMDVINILHRTVQEGWDLESVLAWFVQSEHANRTTSKPVPDDKALRITKKEKT